MICAIVGCGNAAIALYTSIPVKLRGGTRINIDLALCINCEIRIADEKWTRDQWPVDLTEAYLDEVIPTEVVW